MNERELSSYKFLVLMIASFILMYVCVCEYKIM